MCVIAVEQCRLIDTSATGKIIYRHYRKYLTVISETKRILVKRDKEVILCEL